MANVKKRRFLTSVKRVFSPPPQSFFLFGPRGTGKSTWANAHYLEAFCVNLLDHAVFRELSAEPARLVDWVRGQPNGQTIVVDEIQKVPALLDAVHKLIEEKRGWTFVLSGSSARKLKRAGTNLLGGRALLQTFHPFMAVELGTRFHLNEALKTGLLPLIYGSPNPEKALSSYVGAYLREEVQQEGIVRKLEQFSRFLEIIAFSHAQTLNLNNIARESQIKRSTVESYMGVLEDLLLSFTLPVFAKRAKRELVQHRKFYYFDAGVFSALRRRGPFDKPEEMAGHALEGLVAQHLRAWNAYGEESHDLGYWRTPSGVEVDFVVYGPRGLWAIEVKNTNHIRPEDLRSLRDFKKDYPEAKLRFVYRGAHRQKLGDIEVVPAELFLSALRPGQPVP